MTAAPLRREDVEHAAAKYGLSIPDGPAASDSIAPFDPLRADSWWAQREDLAAIHAYARAVGASPPAVLAVTIMRVLAQTPHTVALPGTVGGGRGSLNLFAALVGRSGGGKGAATSAARHGVLFPGGQNFEELPPGSAEGLVRNFATSERDPETGEKRIEWHNRSVLFDVAEVSDLAGQMGRSGSVLTGQLLSAFSGERLGFTYAGGNGVKIPAHEYRFTMVAGVQPLASGALLGDDAAGKGLPQRFLWALTADPGAPDFTLDALSPAPLTLPLPRWEDGPGMVGVDDSVLLEIGQNHRLNLRGGGAGLDGHRMFARLKVAAALSFMRGAKHVTWEDWWLAEDVMAHSDIARQSCVDALERAAVESAERKGRDQGLARLAASDAEAEARAKRVTQLRRTIMRHWEEQGRPRSWAPVRRALRSDKRGLADMIAMDLASEIPGFPASDTESA